MGRTQVWGALVLAILMAGVISNVTFAIDDEVVDSSSISDVTDNEFVEPDQVGDTTEQIEQVTNERTTSGAIESRQRSSELSKAIEDARKAQEYAAAHPSTIYPGIDKYIAKLIEAAEANKGTEAQALEALGDATDLTYKLLGNNKQSNIQSSTQTYAPAASVNAAREEEKVVSKVEVAQTTSQPNVEVAVAETKPEERSEGKVEEKAGTEEKSEEIAELPKAGIVEHEIGAGEIMMVGTIVALATAGLAAVIIRSKRNA